MADRRIVTVTMNPAFDKVLEAPGFRIGGQVTARRLGWYPAGKGVNVSRVLAILGGRSIATGFVGRNELRLFEEHLERTGEGRIVCQLLVVRGRTRDNITIVDPINDTETHIRDVGFRVQDADVDRLESKLAMLARPGAVMAFCGSLPPGLEPERFAEMVRRSRRAGALVVVDTSEEALRALQGEDIWLAKLNVDELATLSGMPVDTPEEIVAAAHRVSVDGGGSVRHVVATRGEYGAVMAAEGLVRKGWVIVHPGRVQNTVGCGDSLLAGMLRSLLLDDQDWVTAFREGLAVATANACSAEAGSLKISEVEEFRLATTLEGVGGGLEGSVGS